MFAYYLIFPQHSSSTQQHSAANPHVHYIRISEPLRTCVQYKSAISKKSAFSAALSCSNKVYQFSPLFQANPPTTGSSPSYSHQFVFGVGQVRLLVAVIMGCPAVGHQEVEDGRVVGDLWTSPAHHQSAAVHMLHLHVDGSTAAYCDTGKSGQERKRGDVKDNKIEIGK